MVSGCKDTKNALKCLCQCPRFCPCLRQASDSKAMAPRCQACAPVGQSASSHTVEGGRDCLGTDAVPVQRTPPGPLPWLHLPLPPRTGSDLVGSALALEPGGYQISLDYSWVVKWVPSRKELWCSLEWDSQAWRHHAVWMVPPSAKCACWKSAGLRQAGFRYAAFAPTCLHHDYQYIFYLSSPRHK